MNSNFSWGQNTDGSIPDLLFTRRCHDVYHVMFLYVVFSWCVFDVEGNHTCIFHLEIFRLLVPVVVVVFLSLIFPALLFCSFFWFMIHTGCCCRRHHHCRCFRCSRQLVEAQNWLLICVHRLKSWSFWIWKKNNKQQQMRRRKPPTFN